jgi:hypothetical protein
MVYLGNKKNAGGTSGVDRGCKEKGNPNGK